MGAPETAAERFFLRKAQEVVDSAAQVSADLSAVKVRLEEHGRSIQDLRARHEHPLLAFMRWAISVLLAIVVGYLLGGG